MAGVLSGLSSLGLDNLENCDIYADEKNDRTVSRESAKVNKAVQSVKESDLIYNKEMICPVCDKKFVTKIMKSGRVRLIGTDDDLRPRYDGIESLKYDVIMCENCGYSALSKNFVKILSSQTKLISDNICSHVKLNRYDDPFYSYEQAEERYKLALACAVVKKGRSSEKALICLKSAWIFRSHREFIEGKEGTEEQAAALLARENEYLENAYRGFMGARESESFPIAGMDPATLDYLLAQLAYRFGEYERSSKLVSAILISTCNDRIKDRARDLKEQLLALKKTR